MNWNGAEELAGPAVADVPCADSLGFRSNLNSAVVGAEVGGEDSLVRSIKGAAVAVVEAGVPKLNPDEPDVASFALDFAGSAVAPNLNEAASDENENGFGCSAGLDSVTSG